jgi:UDP-3-O-[3-hydroxymyristoyl] N-acetylglucosamine deacetylase
LDFIGDLAILGCPIIGHFVVEKSGHSLNQTVLRQLMEDQGLWESVTFQNPEECSLNSVKIPVFGSPDAVPA